MKEFNSNGPQERPTTPGITAQQLKMRLSMMPETMSREQAEHCADFIWTKIESLLSQCPFVILHFGETAELTVATNIRIPSMMSKDEAASVIADIVSRGLALCGYTKVSPEGVAELESVELPDDIPLTQIQAIDEKLAEMHQEAVDCLEADICRARDSRQASN